MSIYVFIKDLDLNNATVIGFNGCAVEVQSGDLVCLDIFGRAVVKFPIEPNTQCRITRGLPEDVYVDEGGDFEVFEIDYDDEDYFGEEEQSTEVLKSYSYISTMHFTIVIKNNI